MKKVFGFIVCLFLFVPVFAQDINSAFMKPVKSIEDKKQELISTRQKVEEIYSSFYTQYVNDKNAAVSKIRNASYPKSVLDKNGIPQKDARLQREKQVLLETEKQTQKFFNDAGSKAKQYEDKVNTLQAQIKKETAELKTKRTASTKNGSLNAEMVIDEDYYPQEELYVPVTLYLTENVPVWEGLYLSAFKKTSFGKDVSNSDRYELVQLLRKNLSKLDFEVLYSFEVHEESYFGEISTVYELFIDKITVTEKSTGKIVQERPYGEGQERRLYESWIDISEKKGTKQKVQKELDDFKAFMTEIVFNGYFDFIPIPGKNYEVMDTEVTRKLFYYFRNDEDGSHLDYPMICLDLIDAICFCNMLSKLYGFTPVYSYEGNTDLTADNLPKHSVENSKAVYKDPDADGFRLPELEEWIYAAKGGQEYEYNGWLSVSMKYRDNEESYEYIKPVGCHFPNDYGLYDMFGSCRELTDVLVLIDESDPYYLRNYKVMLCDVSEFYINEQEDWGFKDYTLEYPTQRLIDIGMRLFRTIK